jgi:PII-like signaling protein
MIRIYLKPGEKRKQPSLRGFLAARPLYRELVDAAKQSGFLNAIAQHTHYGFSNHGPVQSQNVEAGNPDLTMCVEILGPKQDLETFCRTHGELLRDKVIVYKHIEHWDVHLSDVEKSDAPPDEIDPASA